MEQTENNLGFEVLPLILRDLIGMVVKKKTLPLEDALHYVYTSRLYQSLLDEKTKTWYLSTISLYDLLEKEKKANREKQQKEKELLFKTFCIENFKLKENLTATEVLLLFSKYSVFDFLDETFEMLHTQDKAYIVDSISVFIKNKNRKLNYKLIEALGF